MNNENKWIKLHSKILNWEWYRNRNTRDLFIHLLLKANWKDKKFQGIVIPRGSLATSRNKLMEELDMTEQEIRTAQRHLVSTNEITIKSTKKFTIITITNYDKYQQNNQVTNQQLTNDFCENSVKKSEKYENLTNNLTNDFTSNYKVSEGDANQVVNNQTTNNQPTNNQQLTTIVEYKEYKNIDDIDNISTSPTTTKTGETIFDVVQKEFGRTISPMEFEIMNEWLKSFSEDLILNAIKESVLNNAFSFRYVERILDRYKREGIKTVSEAQKSQVAFKNEKEKKVELFDYDWLTESEEEDV